MLEIYASCVCVLFQTTVDDYGRSAYLKSQRNTKLGEYKFSQPCLQAPVQIIRIYESLLFRPCSLVKCSAWTLHLSNNSYYTLKALHRRISTC